MKTFIPWYHNIYHPNDTCDGGREKATTAIAYKVIQAIDSGKLDIMIFIDGLQVRSFQWIGDRNPSKGLN